MDVQTFAAVMGNAIPLARYEAMLPAWNAALLQAQCTTVNRVAMWSAQVAHESGGLLWMNEIASGSAYEGRADLGNTQPGDGVRFKGHGPVQITGRSNHTAVSLWAFRNGYVPNANYFVDHPAQLGSDQYGFLGVVWYWTVARTRMNSYADAGDILAATRAVNGGTNGLADRTSRWHRALTFGAALLPSGGDDMASVPQNEWNDVHAQEMRSEPPWAGGYTDDKGSPYDLFMYVKRTNVEMHQCWLAVQALTAKVDALTALLTAKP